MATGDLPPLYFKWHSTPTDLTRWYNISITFGRSRITWSRPPPLQHRATSQPYLNIKFIYLFRIFWSLHIYSPDWRECMESPVMMLCIPTNTNPSWIHISPYICILTPLSLTKVEQKDTGVVLKSYIFPTGTSLHEAASVWLSGGWLYPAVPIPHPISYLEWYFHLLPYFLQHYLSPSLLLSFLWTMNHISTIIRIIGIINRTCRDQHII